jgi:hypothetical protein
MPTKVNIKPSESVHTQYMGPTNTRGARIKGTLIGGKSVTVPYSYELSATDNHANVAAALLKSKNLACTDDRKRGYLWSKR